MTIAWEGTNSTDARVKAVRADKLVGRGSCSFIDECVDDAALIDLFNDEGITTEEAAVEYARDQQEWWLERGLNARWGEDDDPQLKAWKEWKQAREDNPTGGKRAN